MQALNGHAPRIAPSAHVRRAWCERVLEPAAEFLSLRLTLWAKARGLSPRHVRPVLAWVVSARVRPADLERRIAAGAWPTNDDVLAAWEGARAFDPDAIDWRTLFRRPGWGRALNAARRPGAVEDEDGFGPDIDAVAARMNGSR